MGLDTNWVLEGIASIDAPLNVWNIEVYREQSGTPLSYYRLHIEIDDDPNLWKLLNDKLHGPVEHFDKLILFERRRKSPGDAAHPHVYAFRQPWLYSLERNFTNSINTARSWKKPVLGIAFEKSALHTAAVAGLMRTGVY